MSKFLAIYGLVGLPPVRHCMVPPVSQAVPEGQVSPAAQLTGVVAELPPELPVPPKNCIQSWQVEEKWFSCTVV